MAALTDSQVTKNKTSKYSPSRINIQQFDSEGPIQSCCALSEDELVYRASIATDEPSN